jgi:hypothetical protein
VTERIWVSLPDPAVDTTGADPLPTDVPRQAGTYAYYGPLGVWVVEVYDQHPLWGGAPEARVSYSWYPGETWSAG